MSQIETRHYTQDELDAFNEQNFAYLEVEVQENVLTVTLNRPEKRNALCPKMLHELAYAFDYANYMADIWVVVLKANGQVFCSGADLKAFMGATETHDSTISDTDGEILMGELFNQLYKPLICRLHANVYAGGLFFLAGANFVVADEAVSLGLPEVKRGLFPYQVMASLMEVMPKREVINWCISGNDLSVADAKSYGLVTHSGTYQELDGIIRDLIEKLKENSPSAVQMGLQAFQKIGSVDSAEHHQYLQEMLMKTISTKDAQEGMMAFREKRKPVWTGK